MKDKIDELIDAVNYGLFAIGRLDDDRVKEVSKRVD